MPNNKTISLHGLIKIMVGELCAVLLQSFYLTLDSTTVFSVFLIMWYFIYFMCNPIASSLCNTKHGGQQEGWAHPLLGHHCKPEANGTLSITVYRKPSYADQYLQWDSHHHISATLSVIHTLSPRVQTVCSGPELLQQEKDHLRKALSKCKYPKWALHKAEKRLNMSTRDVIDGANRQGTTGSLAITSEVKLRATLSYPTHKVFVKVLKRSVVDMAFKPTS